jgi:hypothetical protein
MQLATVFLLSLRNPVKHTKQPLINLQYSGLSTSSALIKLYTQDSKTARFEKVLIIESKKKNEYQIVLIAVFEHRPSEYHEATLIGHVFKTSQRAGCLEYRR